MGERQRCWFRFLQDAHEGCSSPWVQQPADRLLADRVSLGSEATIVHQNCHEDRRCRLFQLLTCLPTWKNAQHLEVADSRSTVGGCKREQ